MPVIIDETATISLALIVSIISIVGSFISIWRNKKKDDIEANARKEKELEEKVKMNIKLDSICETTRQIQIDNKQYINKINELDRRVSVLEKACDLFKKYVKDEGAK